jgi:hypothetical protein
LQKSPPHKDQVDGYPGISITNVAEPWSVMQSSNTYATIKRVREARDAKYVSRKFKVVLQGSHCNNTTIYSESNVDVVIRFDQTFHFDASGVDPADLVTINVAPASAAPVR